MSITTNITFSLFSRLFNILTYFRKNKNIRKQVEQVLIEVTNITGIGIFRTGSLTAQRGNSTPSENSTLTSRPHSALPDARPGSRLRNAAPGGLANRMARCVRSRLSLLGWNQRREKRAEPRRTDVFRLSAANLHFHFHLLPIAKK